MNTDPNTQGASFDEELPTAPGSGTAASETAVEEKEEDGVKETSAP